jgi:hypothetical protein
MMRQKTTLKMARAPRAPRTKARAYKVNTHICVARGDALANPQYSSGGATQYDVSPLEALGQLG